MRTNILATLPTNVTHGNVTNCQSSSYLAPIHTYKSRGAYVIAETEHLTRALSNRGPTHIAYSVQLSHQTSTEKSKHFCGQCFREWFCVRLQVGTAKLGQIDTAPPYLRPTITNWAQLKKFHLKMDTDACLQKGKV